MDTDTLTIRQHLQRLCRAVVKRPLMGCALAFAAGIAAAQFVPLPNGVGHYILSAALVAVVVFTACAWHRQAKAWMCGAFCLSLLWGMCCVLPVRAEMANARQETGVRLLEGRVLDIRPRADGMLFVLDGVGLDGVQVPYKTYLYYRTGTEMPPQTTIGDVVRTDARMLPIDPRTNPGGFDPSAYYASQGIAMTAHCTWYDVVGSRPVVLQPVRVLLYTIRNTIDNRIAALTAEEWAPGGNITGDPGQADLWRLLLLGRSAGAGGALDEDAFRAAGVAHILSISGLHVTIMAAAVMRLLKGLHPKVRWLFMALLLVGYSAMTGWAAPVTRAMVMFLVMTLLPLLGRQRDPLSGLALAFWLILMVQPYQLFQAGFQLSFLAVLGMTLFSRPVEQWLLPAYTIAIRLLPRKTRLLAYIRRHVMLQPITGSWSALWIVTPSVTWFFGTFSLYSLLSNLLLLPLCAPMLVLCWLAVLCGNIHVQLGWWMAQIPQGLMVLMRAVTLWVARLPGAVQHIPLNVWMLVAWMAVTLLLLLHPQLRLRGRRMVLTVCCVTALAATMIGYIPIRTPGVMIACPDVGQGDCSIISTGSDYWMIDAYGTLTDKRTRGSAVESYLRHKNIRHLKGIFVTHLHSDHAAGVPDVLAAAQVDAVYLPTFAQHPETEESRQLLANIRAACVLHGVPLVFVQVGEEPEALRSGQGLSLEICYPNPGESVNEAGDNTSLALLWSWTSPIDSSTQTALFTGDMEAGVWQLQRDSLDFLKVPHHGSKPSVDENLLRQWQPQYAMIQVGRGNSYGHPHSNTLTALRQANIPIYRSDTCGEVVFHYGSTTRTTTFLKEGAP